MTDIIKRDEFSLQQRDAMFSGDQVQLIKDVICKGATDDELKMFLHTAQRLGLDPLAKQIYAVKRYNPALNREVMEAQTSIDGFRLVAERTGKYEGQTPVQWCGYDGKWVDAWLWPKGEPPAAARAGVHRKGFRETLYAVASYHSYVQVKKDGTPNKTWRTGADFMLAKCAEALALRKSFPQELSGIYTSDEMDHTLNESAPMRTPLQPARMQQVVAALISPQASQSAYDTDTGEVLAANEPEVPALQLVITRIEAAATIDELVSVGSWSKGLTLSADEQKQVNIAYRAKRMSLRDPEPQVVPAMPVGSPDMSERY